MRLRLRNNARRMKPQSWSDRDLRRKLRRKRDSESRLSSTSCSFSMKRKSAPESKPSKKNMKDTKRNSVNSRKRRKRERKKRDVECYLENLL